MTQNSLDANSILMGGGGAPSFKFDRPGATVTGRIVAISEPYQEREYDQNNPGGGAPKFYPKSGDPIMTFNIDLATTLRDPSIEKDDGTRRIYMDGRRIKDAVRTAVRAVNARGLEVGGQLTIAYTHDDVQGDHRSGKNYAVTYTSAANTALMGGEPEQAPQAAPPVQQQWQAPAAAQTAPVAQDYGMQSFQQATPAPAAPGLPPGLSPEQEAALRAWQAQQAQQAS